MNQDLQSEIGDDQDKQGNTSLNMHLLEPIDLDEMICKRICSIENQEIRRKMANQIILVGGVTKTKYFIDALEEAVIDKFSSRYDDTIERVNVEQFNVQLHQ